MELSENEQKLIDLIRQMQWGTIEEITVQDGQPKIVRRAWQSIKLEVYNGNQPEVPTHQRENPDR